MMPDISRKIWTIVTSCLLLFCTNMQALPLEAQIIFSARPFTTEDVNQRTVNEFKALDEIYARAIFKRPIKEMVTGNPEDYFHPETGHLLIEFELKQMIDGNVYSGVIKYLSREDLEKNYFDFDVAPAANRSRDAYVVNFAGGLASYGSEYFRNRQKGMFTMTAFIMDRKGEKMQNGNVSGNFSVDYSILPEGDAGAMKMESWQQKIYQAANEEVVKENQKKMNPGKNGSVPSMIFLDQKGETRATFLAGDEIRGRINLTKPLKEYISDGSVKQLQIDIKSLNDDITGISVTKILRTSELEQTYIDFEISVPGDKAKDVYTNNLGFFRTFYPDGIDPKRILQFELSLATQYNMNYNGLKELEASGELEIDYTKATKSQLASFYNKGEQAAKAAEINADKQAGLENAEIVKKMPLPLVFTKPGKAGYAAYSKETITGMIKARFKVNNVYMLTFDEPEGSGDFTPLKDLSNYPTEKLGNHVFYFAFKDESDGQYKFSGGRLRMLYEGNGKYSEPFIFPYSPIMNGDPGFPFDKTRKKMGFESVFFVDGDKLKKN
jgi:hypothetical protein